MPEPISQWPGHVAAHLADLRIYGWWWGCPSHCGIGSCYLPDMAGGIRGGGRV